MLFLRKSEKAKIEAASKALRIFNGHDSGANLRHVYGDKWWEKISEIEENLRSLVK